MIIFIFICLLIPLFGSIIEIIFEKQNNNILKYQIISLVVIEIILLIIINIYKIN